MWPQPQSARCGKRGPAKSQPPPLSTAAAAMLLVRGAAPACLRGCHLGPCWPDTIRRAARAPALLCAHTHTRQMDCRVAAGNMVAAQQRGAWQQRTAARLATSLLRRSALPRAAPPRGPTGPPTRATAAAGAEAAPWPSNTASVPCLWQMPLRAHRPARVLQSWLVLSRHLAAAPAPPARRVHLGLADSKL